ncbi:hypothetical protein Syun_014087 [Stephania yunnanensis]|uniref:RHOMBOID-like protein n=1 Tax=Stephania yunnanensis TaxID=152371 RepID=A0AAP0JIU8_9MAGN
MKKATLRDELQVEISPSCCEEVVNGASSSSPAQQELKVSFLGFNAEKKGRKESTWVISFLVVVHLLVFAATMLLNDCPGKSSNGNCVFRGVGRLSFQPFQENPLLGPSSSTANGGNRTDLFQSFVQMGALVRDSITQKLKWRLLSYPWLHAGLIHLIINLSSVIFIGIHLEQEFGSWRIGTIYVLSALTGSLMAAIFVLKSPEVGSSGALFGLVGAMLSGIIQNWKVYGDKSVALLALFLVTLINFALGLLPHVDNFSSIGGFISGFLLGWVLLFNPHVEEVPRNKRGLFEYNEKASLKSMRKFDKPVRRIICLVFFILVAKDLTIEVSLCSLAGSVAVVFRGIDANKYCNWCHDINCVPSNFWSCSEKLLPCEMQGSVTCAVKFVLSLKSLGFQSASCTLSKGKLQSNSTATNRRFATLPMRLVSTICHHSRFTSQLTMCLRNVSYSCFTGLVIQKIPSVL